MLFLMGCHGFPWHCHCVPRFCHGNCSNNTTALPWHVVVRRGLPRTIMVSHGNSMGEPRVFMAILWGITTCNFIACHQTHHGIAMVLAHIIFLLCSVNITCWHGTARVIQWSHHGACKLGHDVTKVYARCRHRSPSCLAMTAWAMRSLSMLLHVTVLPPQPMAMP